MLSVAMLSPHGDPLGRIGEPDIGGQCVYIRELAASLAQEGVGVTIFTRDRANGKSQCESIATGATVVRVPCGPKRFLPKEELGPYLEQFAEEVAEEIHDEQIIHSHFWDGGRVGDFLRKDRFWLHTSHSLGRRKLASLPDADYSRFRERIAVETNVIEGCDQVVASTMSEQRDLVTLYGAKMEKVTVFPPGVDANRFRPPKSKDKVKKELGFSNNGPLILSLGRLDERKGFDLYFRAAAEVIRKLSNRCSPQFVLSAGVVEGHPHEVAERDRLRELVRSLDIEDAVRWLPVLPEAEVPRYYRAADVFVMPSRYELFGMVMLEAMASGVPVVATEFGGPPEVITDGETGLLIDPVDIAELADAIAELATDPERRRRMGAAARMRVEQSYSWVRLADQHRTLYEQSV